MAEEFFGPAPTGIRWEGGSGYGVVQYGSDNSQIALFYKHPVPDPKKSREGGRPVFTEKVFVKIHPPGERLNVWDGPATEDHKRRFPIQWQQFQQNQEQIPDGTPIEMLYPDHPAIARTLRAHAVHTVEQCAELSGVAIDQIGMGAQRYSNDAKRYVEMATKGASINQFRHELEERDGQIRVLNQQVEQLKRQLDQLLSAKQTAGVDVQNLQELIAKVMQRPVVVPNPGANFDAQTAQINATHASTTQVRRRPALKS